MPKVTVTNLLIAAAIAGGAWYLAKNQGTAQPDPVTDQEFDWFDWDSYRVEIEEGVDSLSDLLSDSWDQLSGLLD